MQCVHFSKTKFEVSSICLEGYITCFLYIGYILYKDSWNGWFNDQGDGIEWPLSTFVGDTKLGGVADTLEGRAATQTDLVRLEKWALGDLMKFSKGKCKALQLGWHNPTQWDRLGTDCIENSFVEKELRVVVDKLNASQPCALGENVPGCKLGWVPLAGLEGTDSSPPSDTCDTTSAALCLILRKSLTH